MPFRSPILVALVGAVLLLPGSAQAAPTIDGIFNLPQQPVRAAAGPDGNVWVTLNSANPDVAKVAPDGTVTAYDIPAFDFPVGIIAGQDGSMWVTGDQYIGKFPPLVPSGGEKFAAPLIDTPNELAADNTGGLWTASGQTVLKYDPMSTPLLPPKSVDVPTLNARGITIGSDGTVWVANADSVNPGLYPFTFESNYTIKPGTPVPMSSSSPIDVAAGSVGQIAYSNPGTNPQTIGLVGIGGSLVSPFGVGGTDPRGITFGQDKSYWVAQAGSTSIGRYSATGQYSSIPGVPVGARAITKGANDTLWVTLVGSNQIARVTGVSSAARPKPVLSKVSITNKRFKVGRSSTALIAKKRGALPGTIIKYYLLEQATVSIDVQKAKSGRKRGKTCVKAGAAPKKAKKCTRFVTLKTLKRRSYPGYTQTTFTGRIGTYKFPPGRYRFALVAVNQYAQTSNKITKSFKIVK